MLEQPFQDHSVLRQLTALRDLSQKALTARNTGELLERGVELLEEVFHASLARIWLVQPDGMLILKASAGLSRLTVESSRYKINPKEHSYKIGRVARTLEPYISNQITEDGEFDQAWIEKEGLVAAALYPLINCSQLEGVMTVFSRQIFSPLEQQGLSVFASQMTLAIRQMFLREEMQRQERLAILGQLAGAVAHDLRAPLARITTTIELLSEPTVLQPEQQKYLDFINRATGDMAEIIGSLLDYARMVAMGRTNCDLYLLIQEAVSDVAIPENIKVNVEVDQIENLSINYAQMKRVFTNLIKNAVEAMPQGGTITIDGKREECGASINVTDTGLGIEAENLEKIFSPLFTKTVRGTGFGLAASRSIVEAHGGKLQVKSEVGVGSTFTIYLPDAES